MYLNWAGTTFDLYWSKRNKIIMTIMASLDLSIHCYSLFQVLNLEVNG